MAQRRMFSKEIVRSDAFLDMPISSQLLYFQLGMEADDDGFVDNSKTVSRISGTGNDDLKILLTKRFLLPFKDGIIVIKHWKINNYIQADRYKQTKYIDQKNQLRVKENGAYTECIQDVSTLDAQVRLGKDRLGEVSLPTESATPPPFSLNEEIKKLEDSPRRDLNIIAFFLEKKKPDIRSSAQLQTAIKRHLRAAKALSPFEDGQIFSGMKKAEAMTDEWVLETIIKYITK